jgi:hypothetical protein
MAITVGSGIGIGPGITLTSSVLVTTSSGQNVGGSPNTQGFFFAVLNRSEQGWDYFAANGNNGNWTATGDFGSGTATVPVLSVPQDADSVYPIVSGGQFQPGLFYTFSGY